MRWLVLVGLLLAGCDDLLPIGAINKHSQVCNKNGGTASFVVNFDATGVQGEEYIIRYINCADGASFKALYDD